MEHPRLHAQHPHYPAFPVLNVGTKRIPRRKLITIAQHQPFLRDFNDFTLPDNSPIREHAALYINTCFHESVDISPAFRFSRLILLMQLANCCDNGLVIFIASIFSRFTHSTQYLKDGL
ncbi:MAG: hypothetical protein IJU61_00340 [Victivallales bacterium]|nr:hypothetical protein [Victivallales bacterium]